MSSVLILPILLLLMRRSSSGRGRSNLQLNLSTTRRSGRTGKLKINTRTHNIGQRKDLLLLLWIIRDNINRE